MATHEAELKEIKKQLTLHEAELGSNEEELQGLPYHNRSHYLELRNEYLKETIEELKKKATAKEEAIAWELRTR